VDNTPLSTGPSADGQPEPTVPGAIEELLRRVPSEAAYQRRAFDLLQRYRGEALAAIARCTAVGDRRHAVQDVQASLRERLLALLAECECSDTSSEVAEPEALRSRLRDADLLRMEREYRTEYEREVAEAEQRLHTTYLGLLSHETWLHTLDGMNPSAAGAAARANLALRLQAMEVELQALTAHHQERYVRRLRELAAMQEDRRMDGE
jgi:hypothetical protein